MTAPDVVELGRRAVACPGWRWVPGMLLECGDRLAWSDSAHWHASGEDGGWRRWRIERLGDPERGSAPDLTDPATLGCLLALVREAWGDVTLTTHFNEWSDGTHGWCVCCDHEVSGLTDVEPVVAWQCKTEAEALIAALESAPVRP